MKRSSFIKSLFTLPFVREIDLDDISMFSHWHEEVEVEPSIFAHWHEGLCQNLDKPVPLPQCVESKIVDFYSPGKWTPLGPVVI